MKEPLLSHLDKAGRARMVDVTAKMPTARLARAEAVVILGRALAARLRRTGALSKGNVLETARLAGIQGAKQTANLIPCAILCPSTLSRSTRPLSAIACSSRPWRALAPPPVSRWKP